MADLFNLKRFVEAQESVYRDVVSELRQGQKNTHWMWFIFPQIAGLGVSSISIFYAISSASEAEAYLLHPILGQRLKECTNLVLDTRSKSAKEIFGSLDDLKFRSCMTLFAKVSNEKLFLSALGKFFDGKFDLQTLRHLDRK
jgi:uncharacterized protein (DUF1810 family)